MELDPNKPLRCNVLRCSGLTGATCAKRCRAKLAVCGHCSVGAAFADANAVAYDAAAVAEIVTEKLADRHTVITAMTVPAGVALVFSGGKV